MSASLLCIGLTTLDICARPVDALTHTERAILIDGIACTPAGTAGGAALVAGKLGLAVKIVGAVGDDLNGLFVRKGFEAVGVDTSLLATRPGEPTSATLLAVETDGTRSSYHAPGAGGGAAIDAAVTAAACASGFVHYAAVGGRATDGGPGAELLRAVKAAGAVVTCDLIGPRRSAAEELARLLPHVDYFMPSAAEATFLSGLDDLPAAAEYFRGLGAGACLIKDGGRGVVVSIAGERRRLPAHAITPLDTTTCGDSFCAGFIAALSRGWAPLDAARFATASAALVALGLGSLGKLQGFAETEAAMREMPLAG
ncbi:MAG TPA: carbohydrate kinase family protein [Caulobacteraceae bacterium]|nr:carbohydrate kinase family protein [Caulobacteraceae bacterium]